MHAKGMSKRAKTGQDKSSAGFKKPEKSVTSKPPEKASSGEEGPAANLEQIASAFKERSEDIVSALKTRGYYIGDGLLGESALRTMRSEAVKLRELGLMTVGKSTRWNEEKQEVEVYEKDNVFTMQVEGGEQQYAVAPRLVEYVVQVTRSLPAIVNAAFPQAALRDTHQTNKLAVCAGAGARYDKHYDNEGGADARKLTALYYMNPDWQPEHGGCFRAYDPLDPAVYTDVEPRGDRFFCFWSDALIHAVMPCFADTAAAERYALTVWLYAASPAAIARDPAAEAAHFPHLSPAASRAVAG